MKAVNVKIQPDLMTGGDFEELGVRLRGAADGTQLQFVAEERSKDTTARTLTSTSARPATSAARIGSGMPTTSQTWGDSLHFLQ